MNIAPACRPGARSAPIMPVPYGCAKHSAIFDDLFIALRQSDEVGGNDGTMTSKRPAMMRALLKRYRQEDERQARGNASTSARDLVEKVDSARGEHAE
ncbi:hypothetical protein [Paraburkholderia kururiensis]|uniref:Uncharacterized protein n=1 Tax=Paraburkholderia kururiensis TaxID=984307 RepID=A0ABZ0WIK9_9BURK|nr:hypothetical protein [Paraburkholderia kururiensis]WQD77197.1 hypothetical protein U0042_24535 [Paraburkholderia kururiensis]